MHPSAHFSSAAAKFRSTRLGFAPLLLGALALTLVLAPAAVHAQSFATGRMEGLPAPSATATEVVLAAVPVNSCPVSLSVRQSAEAFARQVQAGARQEPAQRLQLTATGPDSRRIVAAHVTVRGYAGAGRMLQTETVAGRPNAARALNVRFTPGAGGESSAELRVPTLTAAALVQVNSVTYDDGSQWTPAAGQVCSAPVDALMRVAGR